MGAVDLAATDYNLSGAVTGWPYLDLLLPTYHSLLTTTVNLLGGVDSTRVPSPRTRSAPWHG